MKITIDVDEIISNKVEALELIRVLATNVIRVTHCIPHRPHSTPSGPTTGWRGMANIDGTDLMITTDKLKTAIDKWHNTNT